MWLRKKDLAVCSLFVLFFNEIFLSCRVSTFRGQKVVKYAGHSCLLIELSPIICNYMTSSLCFQSCEDHSLLKSYNGSLKNSYRSGPIQLRRLDYLYNVRVTTINYLLGCGGNFRSSVAEFSSPLHPNNYVGGLDCIYLIETDPGKVISLVFIFFELEIDIGCPFDYVKVYDGPSDMAPLIGT